MYINGMPDHLHLQLGVNANCKLSELVRDIKANSPEWVNKNKLVKGKFEWQNGFGAFTVGQSQLQRINGYIRQQEKHHQRKSFRDEYIDFLKTNQIDFNPTYIIEDFNAAPTKLNNDNCNQ